MIGISHSVYLAGRLLSWPSRRFRDAIEFRRLRHKIPNAHRRLITTSNPARQETDMEYLERLRQIYREREGKLPPR